MIVVVAQTVDVVVPKLIVNLKHGILMRHQVTCTPCGCNNPCTINPLATPVLNVNENKCYFLVLS